MKLTPCLLLLLLTCLLAGCANVYERLGDDYRPPDSGLLSERVQNARRWQADALDHFERVINHAERMSSSVDDRRQLDDLYQEAMRHGWEARRQTAAVQDVAAQLDDLSQLPLDLMRNLLDSLAETDRSLARMTSATEVEIGGALGVNASAAPSAIDHSALRSGLTELRSRVAESMAACDALLAVIAPAE